ncbi:maltokinase N-terminal cap-like domain-containing protein [Actinocatenispora thailandica]|uniref:maltokinase N-terminal cap-like domain-containing protein n=1 Tax=Actinocatenispora thailandica TaxID=227318 RepID=UPI0031D6A627
MTADGGRAATDRAQALAAALAGWLPEQRWFAGKHRAVQAVTPVSAVPLGDAQPRLDHLVVEVEYATGEPECYQLLVGWRTALPDRLEHTRIGTVGGYVGYAGLWDDELADLLLDELAGGEHHGGLAFRPEPDAVIARGLPSRVVEVEQSNSSVVFDEESILKLFRRPTPGANPDVELNRALRRVGCPHVAPLLGEIGGELFGAAVSYGMLSAYAANAADGWAMATASVRDLFAEADLRADEVGGDFAAEARRLGEAVAQVHTDLVTALGAGQRDADGQADLSAAMIGRLAEAVRTVPELARYAAALGAEFTAVADVATPCPVQRIHGDLHLGQALRTPTSWLLIDFEGEPVKPLAERVLPDSPLRDVAGMLRSFDYAAEHLLVGEGADHQLEYRAQEWATRNRSAFAAGYAGAAGLDPDRHRALLRAYELDKAVYEVVYEARHRPAWRWIPLRSIARMLGFEVPPPGDLPAA